MSAITTDVVLDKLADCIPVDRHMLTDESTAHDFQSWDSVAVVEIALMLQQEFKVKVPPKEAHRLTSVPVVLTVIRDAGRLP